MKPQFNNVKIHEISCRTEPLEKPPVSWAKMIVDFLHEEKSYRIRPMDRPDIDGVANLYNEFYPHLYGSSRHYLLNTEHYEKNVAMLSTWEEDCTAKNYFAGVIEQISNGEIIFAFGMFKEYYDRVVQPLAIVLNPAFRGVRLTEHYTTYFDELAAKSGADYAFGTVQVRDVIAQRIGLRAGFKMGGIMPGSFRWSFDGINYFRDTLLYFYKFYNGSVAYSTHPKDWQLANKQTQAFVKLSEIEDKDL